MTKVIKKVVLTGGPCGGKTTGALKIKEHLQNYGWHTIIVPETATEIIKAGINPLEMKQNLDFQENLFGLQLEKERRFEALARGYKSEKVLVLYDRGAPDGEAYTSPDEWDMIMNSGDQTFQTVMNRYDAVLHMVSAADGAEEFYTLANNVARREGTIEIALEQERKTKEIYIGHPHYVVIDNSTDFEKKIRRAVDAICSVIGIPETFEIERKFLIELPDIGKLKRMPRVRRDYIRQEYLLQTDDASEDGVQEVRVRMRGRPNDWSYTKTTKIGKGIKRVEREESISEREYINNLALADPSLRPIVKNRYCCLYENQHFEVDIYPDAKEQAICEIELRHESDEIMFPEFIRIIREVTDDNRYRNREMARENPLV